MKNISPLVQPILATTPEPSHPLSDVLKVSDFINLLKEEEDYFPGEQQNTKLMITRLRKIFYDQWGWNSELIRGAASIEMRYIVKILDNPTPHSKPVTRYEDNEYQPKHREVVYRDNDRVYGNTRAGQSPFIYKNDHQECVLPDGTYCDVAHILAGLDAFNYPQTVTPLPSYLSFLSFLINILPHVNSNADIVTWLGDIASSSGDFLFYYLLHGKKPLDAAVEQNFINTDAPGSDMLGDIEPYVIKKYYDVSAATGRRLTDILEEYYFDDTSGKTFREKRFSTFCSLVGLEKWDGQNFGNEQAWLTYYEKQLRDNICFQVFSLTNEKLKSLWLPIVIYFNGLKDVTKHDLLLKLFLASLKELIKREPQP